MKSKRQKSARLPMQSNLAVSFKKEYKLNQGPIDLEMIQIPGTNFEMLETPVTQKLYETVTGKNPSYFDGETNPVEMVNFFDAIIFCNLLSVNFSVVKIALQNYYRSNSVNGIFSLFTSRICLIQIMMS